MDNPIQIIEVRAEGYFAVTSNSIQFGGRWEIGIELGIEAHGFLQVDAIVQFRPFHFEARVAAGFDVSAGGFSFASVTLEGVDCRTRPDRHSRIAEHRRLPVLHLVGRDVHARKRAVGHAARRRRRSST